MLSSLYTEHAIVIAHKHVFIIAHDILTLIVSWYVYPDAFLFGVYYIDGIVFEE